jgi:hypothetical protein
MPRSYLGAAPATVICLLAVLNEIKSGATLLTSSLLLQRGPVSRPPVMRFGFRLSGSRSDDHLAVILATGVVTLAVLVVSRSPVEVVVTLVSLEIVVALIAFKRVVAMATLERVVAATSLKGVVALVTLERIIIGIPLEGVVPGVTRFGVDAIATDLHVVSIIPAECV